MDKSVQKEAVRRLAIAEGHLNKVKKMVGGDVYCLDIIHQSRAVQAALKKVDELVLHGHLHSCVLHDIHEPKGQKEKLVEEIVEVFRKSQ